MSNINQLQETNDGLLRRHVKSYESTNLIVCKIQTDGE